MSKSSNSSSGIGCTSVIQIVFLILKLTNLIDWSWWWVFSPTWISILLFVVIVGLAALASWLNGY